MFFRFIECLRPAKRQKTCSFSDPQMHSKMLLLEDQVKTLQTKLDLTCQRLDTTTTMLTKDAAVVMCKLDQNKMDIKTINQKAKTNLKDIDECNASMLSLNSNNDARFLKIENLLSQIQDNLTREALRPIILKVLDHLCWDHNIPSVSVAISKIGELSKDIEFLTDKDSTRHDQLQDLRQEIARKLSELDEAIASDQLDEDIPNHPGHPYHNARRKIKVEPLD